MAVCKKPIFSKFLWHLPLKTGALFTGYFMGGVFALSGIAMVVLTILWRRAYDDLVVAVGTTAPGDPTNELLDRLHPHFLGVGAAVFFLYSTSSAALVFGVLRGFKPFVRHFLVCSAAAMAACLSGHLYAFVAFWWYDKKQLAVLASANVLFYAWWAYSVAVVASYHLEACATEVKVGDHKTKASALEAVDLPSPPRPEDPAEDDDGSHSKECMQGGKAKPAKEEEETKVKKVSNKKVRDAKQDE